MKMLKSSIYLFMVDVFCKVSIGNWFEFARLGQINTVKVFKVLLVCMIFASSQITVFSLRMCDSVFKLWILLL